MAPPGSPAFIALICYEAIFPGLFAADLPGARFILNITNDSWFDGSIGPEKHAHHARLRAAETGLAMVRVANSGVTFLADPLGRETARLRAGEAGVLDVIPDAPLPPTPFDRFGNLVFFGLLAIGLGVAVLSRRRRPRALA
jgi:apolipoprotein N-acyltransferase